jgi:8-oxo-dGTP pyrophosphatase MutT (NUDIX family)
LGIFWHIMNEEKNPWKILSERKVYENPWISLTEFEVINPGGGTGIYGKMHYKNLAVGVLPLDAELNTYLVGQYRFTLDQFSWEIPEGGSPEGEHPLDAAKRELAEETGLKAGSWEPLLHMHLSNSVTDEFAIIYLARDLTQGFAKPEETEKLEVRKLPFQEVYRMVLAGLITDALSVTAILRLALMLSEGTISQNG